MAFEFDGSFVLFLLVGVISYLVSVSSKNWIVTLVLFFIGIGAISIALDTVGLSAGWSFLIIAVMFLISGVTSVKFKTKGNVIMGIILLVLGIAAVFPAVNLLGSETPGTIWDAIIRSFQTGWSVFEDMLSRLFGNS